MAAAGLCDELLAVGVVPDEVLLLCGRPASTPSGWWTPWLDACAPDVVERRRRDAADVLRDEGVLDADGAPTGLLAEVAAVVAAAERGVLLERETRAGVRRCSLVAATDRVLVDEQRDDLGAHELTLATPRAAVALLVGLLDPSGRASGRTGRPRRRTPSQVERLLPTDRRVSTCRVVAPDRLTQVSQVLSLVDDGCSCWIVWSPPDGDCRVWRAGGDDVVDLALLLLGAEVEGPAPC